MKSSHAALFLIVAISALGVSYSVAEAQLFEGSKLVPPPPPLTPVGPLGGVFQGPPPGQIEAQMKAQIKAAKIIELKHQIYNITLQLNHDISTLIALETELNTLEPDELHLTLTATQNEDGTLEDAIELNATSYTVGDTIDIDVKFYHTLDELYSERTVGNITHINAEHLTVTLSSTGVRVDVCTINHHHKSYDLHGPLPSISAHVTMCLIHPDGHVTMPYLIGTDMPLGEYRLDVQYSIGFETSAGQSTGRPVGYEVAFFNITASVTQ